MKLNNDRSTNVRQRKMKNIGKDLYPLVDSSDSTIVRDKYKEDEELKEEELKLDGPCAWHIIDSQKLPCPDRLDGLIE